MKLVDIGCGPALIVVPGVQGRWEWMEPAIRALAARCRVITFSFSDEPCSEGLFDEVSGFACYVEQVRHALDQCGVQAAAICGVSYGGLVAAAFAARYPGRTRALLLASAPPPSWKPDGQIRLYLRAPRLFAIVFWIASPLAMYAELAVAVPSRLAQLRLVARCAWRAIAYPSSPTRMARRARLIERMTPLDLTLVRAPTLVVTGEAALDRIMPVRATHEYVRLIPQSTAVTLNRTGHVGMVTRPEAFADAVASFVSAHASEPPAQDRRHAV